MKDQIDRIEQRVAGLSDDHKKVRELLVRIDERQVAEIERSKDQEKRIRGLERWRNILAGAGLATTGAIGRLFTLS